MHTSITRGPRIVGALALTIAVAAGCASPHDTTPPAPADPIKFGFIYSQTGSLAGYAPPYLRGFEAGLAYATKGTGKVNGRPIEVVKADDGGDPAKATSAMKDLIGQGVKIVGGTGSSSVAVQLAPLAAQNKVLYISGPAATDAITGANRYTFRAGRQTLQDILNIKHAIGDTTLKKVAVFVQDNTFGQGNLAAVKAVAFGATVPVCWCPHPAPRARPTSRRSRCRPSKLARTSCLSPGPVTLVRRCGRPCTSRACWTGPR